MKKLLFFASAVAMLASCSKDLTDDVVIAPKGNSKIIATVVEDAETRVHLDGGNYFWDNGDGVGLFNVTEDGDDATNAYFGFAGNANEFEGEFRVMTGDNYYGYYPYSDDQKVEGHKITLKVKGTQNYSFSNTTFGAGVAPVVAKGPATDEKTLPLEFKPVASYLIVPVYGYGDVKKVELTIENATLWGDITVDLSKIDDVDDKGNFKVGNIDPLSNSDSKAATVTLNCGRGVKVSADPKNPTEFWFVVPAQTLSQDGKVTVKVNDEAVIGERTLANGTTFAVNKAANLKAEADGEKVPFKWVEGGAYLIENEFDFLKYAFAATNGVNGTPAAPGEMKDESGNLRPAMIITDLYFGAEYDPDGDIKKSEAGTISDFELAIIKAYQENGGIKEIIPADANSVYSVKGNKDGEAATITGLVVAKNNGVFGVNSATDKPSISNIILENTIVDNTYVLLNNYNSANYATLENITVNGTYETATAVGYTYTSMLKDKQPVTCGEGVKLADKLYVNQTATLGTEYFAKDFAAFNNVYPHNTDGAIVTIADKDAAEALIKAIKPNSNNATAWFSVVENEPAAAAAAAAAAPAVKTSFWTGLVADKVVDNGVYTAEEFAYQAQTVTEAAITLTCDIDLMGNPWVVGASSTDTDKRKVVTGNDKTVKNLYITDKAEEPARKDYTMFGTIATVKNLTVDGVTIEVPEGIKDAVVATFAAMPGAVSEKAVVNNFNVTLGEGVTLTYKSIGGLYAVASGSVIVFTRVINDKGNNLTGEVNIPEDVKFGTMIGKMSMEANGEDIVLSIPKDIMSPAVGIFGLSIMAGTNADTNLVLKCDEAQMPYTSFVFTPSETPTNLTIWAYYGDKGASTQDAKWYWTDEAVASTDPVTK